MADFAYEDLLPVGADDTPYRLLTTEGVREVDGPGGRRFLEVDAEALRLLTDTAMHDIAHYLRPAPLKLPFVQKMLRTGLLPRRRSGRRRLQPEISA